MTGKLFAALLTVLLCIGSIPTQNPSAESAAPAETPAPQTVQESAVVLTETNAADQKKTLTEAEAKAIAQNHAGLSAVVFSPVTKDYDWGVLEYEVEFRHGDWEYDYEIHGVTGEVLEHKKEYDPEKKPLQQEPPVVTEPPAATQTPVTEPPVTQTPAEKLTWEQARDIALKHAGLSRSEVSGLEVEYDWEKGVVLYEVEFRHGFWEYDYEIHGTTGAILAWEKDD